MRFARMGDDLGPDPPGSLYIDALATDQRFRRRGVATALLGAADHPSLPASLIATLALTTLLPSIPALKRVDEWLLSVFLDWAEIPAGVKRRAAAMTPLAVSLARRPG